MIKQLYKMKDNRRLQSWYNTDYYILIKSYTDRYVYNSGTECKFCNVETGEIINRCDRDFEPVSKKQIKNYWRNHILKNVLKEV